MFEVTQLVNCTYKLPEPLEESPHASASPVKIDEIQGAKHRAGARRAVRRQGHQAEY